MDCRSQAAPARLVDMVERTAIGASLLCLVHCIGLPLLLALLPALSQALAVPESVHLWLLALAVPSAAIALGTGYRQHGAPELPVLGGSGLALMAAGALLVPGDRAETVLTVAGGLLLVSAHIGNWRLRHARHRCG